MLDQYRYSAGEFSVNLVTLSLTGSEVLDFLQNQSTCNALELHVGSFKLCSFLDPQGRVECYGWLLRRENEHLYLVPECLQHPALERLNRFLVSEDVTITNRGVLPWFFALGPEAPARGYSGTMLEESAFLSETSAGLPSIDPQDLEEWRVLNGWPSFTGQEFRKEIINTLRLFDLSVSVNKGCYPGQETVSKIATHRGAAFSPVLLETEHGSVPGEISVFGKKAGVCLSSTFWKGKYYLQCSLLRDFRVAGMAVQFQLQGQDMKGIVRYFPLLSGQPEDKARDLFFEGSDAFRKDNLAEAERKFRLAIRFDSKFGDAYETLGVMLGRQERYDEAIAFMRQLSEVDPDSVLAHTNLSLFLMKQGKIEEAEQEKSLATIKSFRKFGEEADQKKREEELLQKKASEWAQRESMFLQVLEIDPEDTLANFGLGSIEVEKGNFEKARQHLEKVITVDPKYSAAYLALGKAYRGLGALVDARECFIQGIKVAAAKGDLMPANQMQSELDRL